MSKSSYLPDLLLICSFNGLLRCTWLTDEVDWISRNEPDARQKDSSLLPAFIHWSRFRPRYFE